MYLSTIINAMKEKHRLPQEQLTWGSDPAGAGCQDMGRYEGDGAVVN